MEEPERGTVGTGRSSETRGRGPLGSTTGTGDRVMELVTGATSVFCSIYFMMFMLELLVLCCVMKADEAGTDGGAETALLL